MFPLPKFSLALLASSIGLSFALDPATVSGPNFLDSTKKRFSVVGVDYQPGGSSGFNPEDNTDVLGNGTACLRDAALMQMLGVNTVRIYNLDPTVNHDECMSIFNAVGIYVLLDVNSPFESLHSIDPGSSYTVQYMQRVFGMVESFKGYPNTLGFFASNEVMNNIPTAKQDPPFIRAVIRDMKQYIAKQCDRQIPVGYSAADVRSILEDTWNYLQCGDGPDDPSRSDFFGLNSYSWCGDSDPKAAGYTLFESMFASSSVPVFFSEYGCNKVQPRIFQEVPYLYSDNMKSLSGGLVYQWTEDTNDFGLLKIDDDGSARLLQDYETLQKQYNTIPKTQLAAGPPRNLNAKIPKCSPSLIKTPGFNKNFNLPTAPKGTAQLIAGGLPKELAYRGKLVEITDTKVPYDGFTSKGDRIEPFEIKPVNGNTINTPSGGDIASENEGNGGGSGDDDDGALGGRMLASTAVKGGSFLALLIAIASMF